jgi:predicted dienelactone hydrolase
LPPVEKPKFNVGLSIHDLSHTTAEGERVLTTAIWYPTSEEPKRFTYSNGYTSYIVSNGTPYKEGGPYPLILYNHGLYGSGIDFLALTEYLTSQGYIVVSPDYHDTISPDFVTQAALNRIKSDEELTNLNAIIQALDDFQDLAKTTREVIISYMQRFRLSEASFVIDEILTLNEDEGSRLFHLIDKNNVGIAGYSLGGLTALGLIGAYKDINITDTRIKAALIMSAPDPFQDNITGVGIPIMIMHGDTDLPALVPLAEQLYNKTQASKFYMVIRLATHFTFTNTTCSDYELISQCWKDDQYVRLINYYALAFFNRYLGQDDDVERKLNKRYQLLATYDGNF